MELRLISMTQGDVFVVSLRVGVTQQKRPPVSLRLLGIIYFRCGGRSGNGKGIPGY